MKYKPSKCSNRIRAKKNFAEDILQAEGLWPDVKVSISSGHEGFWDSKHRIIILGIDSYKCTIIHEIVHVTHPEANHYSQEFFDEVQRLAKKHNIDGYENLSTDKGIINKKLLGDS